MTITIVHGAQGVGKSTIAPALARHFRSTCVVDEWDGRANLPAGALVTTNVPPARWRRSPDATELAFADAAQLVGGASATSRP